MRTFLGVLVSIVASGCFEPSKPACVFLCGTGGACPDGYACGIDGRCHLMVNGALAECQDQLPADGAPTPDGMADGAPTPDGMADGAAAPDAMVDARPPDAMTDAPIDAVVNQAPVLTLSPTTTTYNLVAGASITITASATDADGDTPIWPSALTSPGSGRDPFEDRGGGDLAGGTWTVGTQTFTFEAGILGSFDVRFSVSDGRGGMDTQDVVINVAASPVMLNEIQMSASGDDVEIVNTGGSPVDISGWSVCAPLDYYSFPASTSIAAGGFVVVHWDQTGTDTATEFYTGTGVNPINTPGHVLLFQGNLFGFSRTIRDFVRFASVAGGRTAQAVFAGQWPTETTVVTTTGLDPGESIARTPGANTEGPADWYVEDTPTIGSANVP